MFTSISQMKPFYGKSLSCIQEALATVIKKTGQEWKSSSTQQMDSQCVPHLAPVEDWVVKSHMALCCCSKT